MRTESIDGILDNVLNGGVSFPIIRIIKIERIIGATTRSGIERP